MTEEPDALRRLLAGEISRHLPRLSADPPDPTQARAVLHALKGSAAMAQEHELSLVMRQLGSALRRGQREAVALAVDLLQGARERLRTGESAFATRWPVPPPLLAGAELDPRYRAEYHAAMEDRLAEMDAAISAPPGAKALEAAYQAVHAMKGAASSVGDDATSWYCHGLETQLQAAGTKAGPALFADLERHRAVIALLLEQPDDALDTLRGLTRQTPSPPGPARSSETAPPDRELTARPGPLLHISPTVVDRLLEHLEGVRLVHDEVRRSAEGAREIGLALRGLRAELLRRMRAPGPVRVWPSAEVGLSSPDELSSGLEQAAQAADRLALVARRNADAIQSRTGEMQGEVAALRRTTVRWLFERVTFAVARLASNASRSVQVSTSGGDLLVDRRVAEQLLEPLLQLARNALAHGIEPEQQRIKARKPPIPTIWLRAERLGDGLRVIFEDDGAGVDVERIRALAVARGAVTAEAAQTAQEDQLLGLLFVPGLTTQEEPDLLAGRGVGLELAQGLVRRLGGGIRLSRRPGSGLVATIEVPGERGIVEVLWLDCAGHTFALPVGFSGRVAPTTTPRRPVALASCLGLASTQPPPLTLELRLRGVQPILLGVDGVGQVEETCVRDIPPLVSASGPYSGAILRSDGSLRLLLDAALLAARAWSHAA